MDHTMELIQTAHAGDKQARDQLVEENMGLIWSVVRRFLGRGYEPEDLFQIGSIGLMKAIDGFDTSFEVRFSTYAIPKITGEIKRFIRDDGMIKVSRTLKENGWKAAQASEHLKQQLGRDATLEEIAAETGITVEDLAMAMEANIEIDSIYKTVYQGDGKEIYLVDKLEDSGREREQLLDSMVLKQLLEELPPEDAAIIRMRYFGEKTQTEVAKRLGISQVQVSRREKKILQKMRKQFLQG
ncbi:SigF/SigG family RNA polymerase sporulation sigma factor [Cuneatibacter caecimuris]|uniref:RNA polymerase sporulation-specific sigma factor n=1 Tax=Cuneatibacter caecimuris TaxID=1796618 RepID=A0A4Q7PPT6_9FIRM|nr:SigF/SigG family RNA polymerase sporulation sigma factor [Cuneatibacter caecimuris]RZT02515.1 RNA polymerase sporulation-specific sigma factor [Cuneatibacter caecimuris]